MAHVQIRQRKPAAVPRSVGKENRAPAKEKERFYASALGASYKARQQQADHRDVLSPHFAGVSKPKAKHSLPDLPIKGITSGMSKVAIPGFFKQFHDPIAKYHDVAEANFERRMAQWRKELENRRNGLNANGKPISKAPVPTREDIDALSKELNELLKPINEEILHIADAQTGGTKARKLGDTMDMLERREAAKLAQIDELVKEQERLDEEVEQLKMEVLGESVEALKAKQDHEAQLAALQKEIEKVEAKAHGELEEMKRKDRETRKAFNRKVQALWDGIMDDD